MDIVKMGHNITVVKAVKRVFNKIIPITWKPEMKDKIVAQILNNRGVHDTARILKINRFKPLPFRVTKKQDGSLL